MNGVGMRVFMQRCGPDYYRRSGSQINVDLDEDHAFVEADRRGKKIHAMQIINPATEKVIGEVAEDTSATVKEKHRLAKEGQPEWAARSVEERLAVIERFYVALEEEKEVLAGTLTAETGKPLQQSYNELNGARTRIRWMLDHAARWLKEEWIVTEGTHGKRSFMSRWASSPIYRPGTIRTS